MTSRGPPRFRKSESEKLRWRQDQLYILEAFGHTEVKPVRAQRDFLAALLGTGSRRVQIWFQNARASLKRQSDLMHKVAATSEEATTFLKTPNMTAGDVVHPLIPGPKCTNSERPLAIDVDLHNEIDSKLRNAFKKSNPQKLSEFGDAVFYYAEQALSYLQQDDCENSLKVLCSVLLSIADTTSADMACDKKVFTAIINCVCEALKQWARVVGTIGAAEQSHLCFAYDIATWLTTALDSRGLSLVVLSLRSTLVATALELEGRAMRDSDPLQGVMPDVPCAVRTLCALADDSMRKAASETITRALTVLSTTELLAAIGASMPSALAEPRACTAHLPRSDETADITYCTLAPPLPEMRVESQFSVTSSGRRRKIPSHRDNTKRTAAHHKGIKRKRPDRPGRAGAIKSSQQSRRRIASPSDMLSFGSSSSCTDSASSSQPAKKIILGNAQQQPQAEAARSDDGEEDYAPCRRPSITPEEVVAALAPVTRVDPPSPLRSPADLLTQEWFGGDVLKDAPANDFSHTTATASFSSSGSSGDASASSFGGTGIGSPTLADYHSLHSDDSLREEKAWPDNMASLEGLDSKQQDGWPSLSNALGEMLLAPRNDEMLFGAFDMPSVDDGAVLHLAVDAKRGRAVLL